MGQSPCVVGSRYIAFSASSYLVSTPSCLVKVSQRHEEAFEAYKDTALTILPVEVPGLSKQPPPSGVFNSFPVPM